MANSDAKATSSKEMERCVVRNVHITVGVKASQRYLIYKTAEETIDDMFIRMWNESRTPAGKKDCETCRIIVKWAEECDGEVCNVLSNYDTTTSSFVLDICIDFKHHTDSEKFCKDILVKVVEGIE